MLKPFGGLKKIFSPKTALKPFKAIHNVAGKVAGKATGGMKPRRSFSAMNRDEPSKPSKPSRPSGLLAKAAFGRVKAGKAAY